MKCSCTVLSVALWACSSGGVPADAGSRRDVPVVDEGFAPTCTMPAPECLTVASQATIVANASSAPLAPIVHGVATTSDGAAILYEHWLGMDGTHHLDTGDVRLQLIDSGGALNGAPLVVDDTARFIAGDVSGTIIGDSDHLTIGWRPPILAGVGTSASIVGFHTTRATVTAGAATALSAVSATSDAFDATPPGVALAVQAGVVWTCSAMPSAIEVAQDATSFRVPSSGPVREVGCTPLGTDRLLVAWSEVHDDGISVVAAVVDLHGAILAGGEVFPPAPFNGQLVAVAPHAETAYVGRYDANLGDPRSGRIRVAEVDAALGRVGGGGDRWFGGWGGLGTGFALTVWRGRTWVIWRSHDVRYGESPVLFAEPLQDDPCGLNVSAPVIVFPPHDASQPIAAAGDATDLWVAVPSADGPGTITSLRVRPCD